MSWINIITIYPKFLEDRKKFSEVNWFVHVYISS